MGCSPPGSSVHGIFQARILEWVAISSSRGSSWLKNQTRVSCISCIGRRILYHCATWETPYISAKIIEKIKRLPEHMLGRMSGTWVPTWAWPKRRWRQGCDRYSNWQGWAQGGENRRGSPTPKRGGECQESLLRGNGSWVHPARGRDLLSTEKQRGILGRGNTQARAKGMRLGQTWSEHVPASWHRAPWVVITSWPFCFPQRAKYFPRAVTTSKPLLWAPSDRSSGSHWADSTYLWMKS